MEALFKKAMKSNHPSIVIEVRTGADYAHAVVPVLFIEERGISNEDGFDSKTRVADPWTGRIDTRGDMKNYWGDAIQHLVYIINRIKP